jgi:hypothetical protein
LVSALKGKLFWCLHNSSKTPNVSETMNANFSLCRLKAARRRAQL